MKPLDVSFSEEQINIERKIWEATEKPIESYQWKFWYHHDGNKESSEWYK